MQREQQQRLRPVARATSPRGELWLRRRDDTDVLELRVNGVYVMDTAEHASERRLARIALDECRHARSVLVGGLGLGFTAREVLDDAGVEDVLVAEIEEPLVGWFRDGTVPGGRALLADPRLRVAVGDVRDVVRDAPASAFDLVLLDVDNGPDHLVHSVNAAVYQARFLEQVRRVLRPGGVVVVWSDSRSGALVQTLDAVFGTCWAEPHEVDLQGRAEQYWLHVARHPLAPVARPASRSSASPSSPRSRKDRR